MAELFILLGAQERFDLQRKKKRVGGLKFYARTFSISDSDALNQFSLF
jgi:hypothetical protein